MPEQTFTLVFFFTFNFLEKLIFFEVNVKMINPHLFSFSFCGTGVQKTNGYISKFKIHPFLDFFQPFIMQCSLACWIYVKFLKSERVHYGVNLGMRCFVYLLAPKPPTFFLIVTSKWKWYTSFTKVKIQK